MIWLLKNRPANKRNRPNARLGRHKFTPRVEALERRELPANSFLQGTAFIDNNNDGMYNTGDLPKPNAKIDLFALPIMGPALATTMTDANGHYQFPNVAPGNYRIVETPPVGFINMGTQTLVSPLTPVLGTTMNSIDVKLVDPDPGAPGGADQLKVNFNSSTFFALNRFEVFNSSTFGAPQSDSAGQMPITLSTPGLMPNPSAQLLTFCTDLFNKLGLGMNMYMVTPSPTPNPMASGMPNNAEQIAYLYNHYGTTLRPNSIDAAALQLAIWELEYDYANNAPMMPDFLTGNFLVSSGVLPHTPPAQFTAVLAQATNYYNESEGKNELAVFLNLATSPSTPTVTRSQGVIVPGSLNFVNKRAIDLSLTKTVDEDMPNVGDTITFTLTVCNAMGFSTATGVEVTDLLPAGLTYVSDNPSQGTYNSGTGVWMVGTLNAGDCATLEIEVTVDSADTQNNAAEVTDADQPDVDSTPDNDPDPTTPQNEDDDDNVMINPQQIDLSLTKTVDEDMPNVGDTITFTLTVCNAMGFSTATGVEVTDLLPAGLTYVSDNPSQGTYNSGTGVWMVGTLNAGDCATLEIEVTVDSADTQNNAAEVTDADQPDVDSTPDNDPDPTTPQNEDDDDNVIVNPQQIDLSLTKTVDEDMPNVGDTITFTLTVCNEVGFSTATGVEVTDLLPAGLTYVSDNPSQGTYNSGTGVWMVGTLNAGDCATLEIEVTVDSADTQNNAAEVTDADQPDVDSTPDNDPDPTTPQNEDDDDNVMINPQQIDLSLTKTVDEDMPNVGDTITFTLTVCNAMGFSTATGVEVTDLLPAGLTYVSDNPSQGTYNSGTGVWMVGTLNAGDCATLEIEVTVDSADTQNNAAEVTDADQPDVDSTPDNDPDPTTPQNEDDDDNVIVNPQQIDLSLTKTVDEDMPNVGDTITFTLTVCNEVGFSTATGVEVTDLLPAGLTYVSDNPSQGTYNSGTGVWMVGTLNAGDCATLEIEVTVDSADTQNNAAEVTDADQPDVDSTPDNDPDPTTPQNEDDDDNVMVMPQQQEPLIDLSLTKTVDDETPETGGMVTFTIEVCNAGPDTATGVEVTDVLPAGLTYVSDTPEQGMYDSDTGVWTVGTIASGDCIELEIKAMLQAATKTIVVDMPVDGSTALKVEIVMLQLGTNIQVTLNVITDGPNPNTGDLRGFFFHVPAALEASLANLSVFGTHVTDVDKSANNVTTTGGGNVINPLGPFDVGVEIGTSGMGGDDIQSTTFTLAHTSPLDLSDFSDTPADYAVRATSVGLPAGSRNGSSKLKGTVLTNAGFGAITNTAEVTDANEEDSDSEPNNNDPNEDDQDDVTITPTAPAPDELCVIIIDEEGLDDDFDTVEDAADTHDVDPDFLINDDSVTQGPNPALRWNTLFPGDIVKLPTGQRSDEGWYSIPTNPVGQNGAFTLEDFVAGTVDQDDLDKVEDVMPLSNQHIFELIGKKFVAVVYDSDISINYDPLLGNLKGDRLGLFYFTVLAVEVAGPQPAGFGVPHSLPESRSDTSLYDVWVRVEAPMAGAYVGDVASVREDSPTSISISTASQAANGTLTVHATVSPSSFQGTVGGPLDDGVAYMTLSVDGPDIGGNHNVAPTLLEVPMTYDPIDMRYEFSGVLAENVVGRRLSVQNDEGGVFNKLIVVSGMAPAAAAVTTKFFVVNDGGSAATDDTYRYNLPGQAGSISDLVAGNNAPRGVAASPDGTTIWVVNSTATSNVFVYNAAGTSLGSWTARNEGGGALSSIEGIATDGDDIWILTAGSSDTVFFYDGGAAHTTGTHSATSSFELDDDNGDARGITTDGIHFWVVDTGDPESVFKYTLAGTLVGSWVIDNRNADPTGITIDPSNLSDLWIVDSNDDDVYQYAESVNLTSGSRVADGVFALASGNTNAQGIADPRPFLGLAPEEPLGSDDAAELVARDVMFAEEDMADLFAACCV